jgi:hypothetical protein
MSVRSDASINDTGKLAPDARADLEQSLERGEPVRVVVVGTLGSALVATDRRVLIRKKHRLSVYPLGDLTEIVFGGGPLVRWIQVRGPRVGLVAPSLLNIGELPDTIQIGPGLDDRIRPVLEMLVMRRGGPLPRDAAESHEGNSVEPLMEARGAGGRLLLLSDRVRIEHRGYRGFFRQALPAVKDIALDEIASVEWRDPGVLHLGHIGLRTSAGSSAESKPAEPENEVMFYLHQQVAFRAIRAAIRRRLGELRRKSNGERAE